MARRTWWLAVALGAVVAAASGPGLIAATGDSATSVGNQVTSGSFAEASLVDLRIARFEVAPEDCPSSAADYDDDSTAAMSLTSTTFDLSGGGSDQAGAFCLLNAAPEVGALSVSFEGVEEAEVGACDETESSAGDTTCVDGDTGELASVVGVEVAVLGKQCSSLSTTFVELHAAPQPIGEVRAGKACRLAFRLRPIGDDAARQRAQTDQVTWDIRFHLQPVD